MKSSRAAESSSKLFHRDFDAASICGVAICISRRMREEHGKAMVLSFPAGREMFRDQGTSHQLCFTFIILALTELGYSLSSLSS